MPLVPRDGRLVPPVIYRKMLAIYDDVLNVVKSSGKHKLANGSPTSIFKGANLSAVSTATLLTVRLD